MKQSKKKIIAREFLLSLLTIAFCVAAFFALKIYEHVQNIELEKSKKEATKNLTQLRKEFSKYPMPAFDKEVFENFFEFEKEKGSKKSLNEFVRTVNDSSLLNNYLSEYGSEMGFEYYNTDSIMVELRELLTPKISTELDEIFFVDKSFQSKYSSLYNEYLSQKNVVKTQKSAFDKDLVSLYAIIFLLIYPVRYLFYAIVWSIQTLKN